jgi:hypothetical protein
MRLRSGRWITDRPEPDDGSCKRRQRFSWTASAPPARVALFRLPAMRHLSLSASRSRAIR